LENVGKVARPIGIALDIYPVGSAYRADGNTIGTNTQRTVSGITGSVAAGAGGAWAGPEAGAAIGSIVPGVGTAIGGAIGGIIGGIAGGWGGDVAGKAVFDWFS
jgi:trimeric autotransporter adhesin